MFDGSGAVLFNLDEFNQSYGLYIFWLVAIVEIVFLFLKIKNLSNYSGTLRKKKFNSAVEVMIAALFVLNISHIWGLGTNMPFWAEMMISLSLVVLIMIASMLLLKNNEKERDPARKVSHYEKWIIWGISLIALGSYTVIFLNGLANYGVL